MKTKKEESQEYLDALVRETNAVAYGEKAAARVVEVTVDEEGKTTRKEIDPEVERAEAARNFEIRSNVARLRHKFNLSQVAFAERLQIPVSTLRKWERNATNPTGAAGTLLKILEKRPDLIDLLD